jgi:hypothetical protein
MLSAGALAACGRTNRDELRETVDAAPSHDDAAPPHGDMAPPPDGGGQPSAGCPPLAVTVDLRGVFAVAANDVWVVGSAGTVLHYDGCWHAEPKATDVDLHGVWVSPDGTVWAGGAAATTLRRSAGAWSVFKTPGTTAVRGIWATGAAVWAADEGGAIYSWDGVAWQLAHANSTEGAYTGIWGAGADDVWVIGNGFEPDGDRASIRVHWDGDAWTESYTCNPDGNRFAAGGWVAQLSDISGTAEDDVWAGGDCGPGASPNRHAFVEQFDGDVWQDFTPAHDIGENHGLHAIWASSETDVWGASADETSEQGVIPTMLHFDGAAWTVSGDPATAGVLDLGGTGTNDVWAVGLRGKRLHFDGAAWTPSP